MTTIGRRWMTAFALALAAHMAVFIFAGSWLQAAARPPALMIAPGGEPLELTLVAEGPPAAVSPPPVPPPPPEKLPEPVKETEPEPVVPPPPKPVLTEPIPEAKVVPPVVIPPVVEPVKPAVELVKPVVDRVAQAVEPVKPVVDRVAQADSMDGMDKVDRMDAKKASAPAREARSDGLSNGSAPISSIHPRYPMGSRLRGEEGPVLVRARVDDRGKPVEVAVLRSSGFLALDEAAVKAVKGARFVPPVPGSPPECYQAELTIRFQLKDP
jgi:protein TonB